MLQKVLDRQGAASSERRKLMRRPKDCSGLRVFLWNDQSHLSIFGLDVRIIDLRGGSRFR